MTLISLTLWAALAGITQLPDAWTWLAIPTVMLLGIMAAQYGFIAHEAAHRQVFQSHQANEHAGRVIANLFAGLSYGFWMRKHNRHHNKPNQIGYDPDINIRVLSFTTDSLEHKHGPEKLLSRNQGWLFPFLLLFTGFDLLADSLVAVTRTHNPVKHRYLEFAMMIIRQATPAIILMILFGPIWGAGLALLMMMTFGLFMGGAFAPNHKGMPLVPENSRIDFLSRQVLTSRNIRSSWLTDNLMGGLNYQVEHHLFPSMPRPHLAAAHHIVTAYCRERNIPFTETTLFRSYGIAIRYLNKVGLSSNADPFLCPMIAQYRPRT